MSLGHSDHGFHWMLVSHGIRASADRLNACDVGAVTILAHRADEPHPLLLRPQEKRDQIIRVKHPWSLA